MNELLQFERVIFNELGEVVARCREMKNDQIQKILNEHEEYYIGCIQI